jgi:beta-galactosidase/beta-glucuronidase
MTMPARWGEGGLAGFGGRVRFRRRFGYPGRLDPTDRVWLTFAGVEACAEVWLNGHFLGKREGNTGPFEFEITPLLLARNELRVEVEGPTPGGGLWGEVALEIRCTAYLRAVCIYPVRSGDTIALHVEGELVGTCDRRLELYVLLDGSTVHYTTLEAAAGGRLFHVQAEVVNPEPRQVGAESQAHEVRVELVNGAVVWYRIDQEVTFPAEAAGEGVPS